MDAGSAMGSGGGGVIPKTAGAPNRAANVASAQEMATVLCSEQIASLLGFPWLS